MIRRLPLLLKIFQWNSIWNKSEGTRKILVLLLLGVVCSFSLLGCGGSLVKETKLPPPLETSQVDLRCSIDPTWKTPMMKYKFTNTVIDAQVDPTGTLLGVLYIGLDETVNKLLLLSLPEFRPIRSFTVPLNSRTIPLNSRLWELQATMTILKTMKGNIIFHYNSIKDAACYEDICVVPDHIFVTYKDDFVTIRDKTTGSLVWKQWKKNCQPDVIFPAMDQDHVFWLNDGLWCASIPDSTIWFLKTNVTSTNYAPTILTGILSTAVGVATGFAFAGSAFLGGPGILSCY